MNRIYSEDDIEWSYVEKYIPYAKVIWSTYENGIPTYKFYGKNGEKINISDFCK
jgi:hypothetical protein